MPIDLGKHGPLMAQDRSAQWVSRGRVLQRWTRTATTLLWALGLAVACDTGGAPSSGNGAPYRTMGASDGESLVLSDGEAVYLQPVAGSAPQNGAKTVARAEAGRQLRIEHAQAGGRFGIYHVDRFAVYDREGLEVATFEPPGAGARHKLIGDGQHVLSPVIEGEGLHGAQIVALAVRDLAGREQARIPVPHPLFTRLSEDHVTVATAQGVHRFGLDGQLRWERALAAHDIALASRVDELLLVDARDRRRARYLRDGIELGRIELRAPIWNSAVAHDGRWAAVTTRSRLHVLREGVLQRSVVLPVKVATTLDVGAQGQVLVGGQDVAHVGHVLCFSREGELLDTVLLPVDDHGFRPRVRFDERGAGYSAVGGDRLHRGECPP